MSAALSRAGRFVLPSLVAGALAAAAGGLVEAVPDTGSVRDALASTGFVALLLVPLGLLASLALRGLVCAWRPAALAAALGEDHGGAPRLAAWLSFLFLAVIALATLVFNAMRLVVGSSSAAITHMLAAPIIAVVAALTLAAVSRPVVAGLAAGWRRLDRAVARRRGIALLRPRAVVGAAVATLLAAAIASWQVSVAPRIGDLDLGFAGALAVWLAALAIVPAGWPWIASRRAVCLTVVGLAALAALLPIGSAVWMRAARPSAMLTLWGETRLAGLAIDLVYDIESLRDEMDPEDIAPRPRPGAPHPDVILVTIDTVRADLTPAYGGSAAMPRLAGLATQTVVFEWAFSPGNVTRRSLPALATGRSPTRVRGRVAGWALKLDPRHVLLAERFAAAGYETAGFFCCDSQFGSRHRLGLARGIEHLEIEYDGGALSERLAAFMAARGPQPQRPLFLWVHFIEPHNWERDHPARADSRGRRERYSRSLAEVDTYLGAALQAAWPAARRHQTVLAVTADHGESLGDHGSRTHAQTLYNTEIRVPLFIAAPGAKPRRVLRPVGLVDLAPTLLELAGFEAPTMPEMDGESLAAVVLGDAGAGLSDGRAYIAQIPDRSVDQAISAVVVGRHKLIVTDGGDRVELYDFVADRAEQRDLAATEPAIRARLEAELHRRQEIDGMAPGAR